MNEKDDQNREREGQGALYKRAAGGRGNFYEGNSPHDELTNEDEKAALLDDAGVKNKHDSGANGGEGLMYTLERA